MQTLIQWFFPSHSPTARMRMESPEQADHTPTPSPPRIKAKHGPSPKKRLINFVISPRPPLYWFLYLLPLYSTWLTLPSSLFTLLPWNGGHESLGAGSVKNSSGELWWGIEFWMVPWRWVIAWECTDKQQWINWLRTQATAECWSETIHLKKHFLFKVWSVLCDGSIRMGMHIEVEPITSRLNLLILIAIWKLYLIHSLP
jgi:hypothetical protein